MSQFLKDPAASLDYAIDWAGGYLAGQAIVSSSWTITPSEAGGLTAAAEALDGAKASITLTGGIVGHVYRVTNRVALTNGLIDERSLSIRVDNR